MSNQIVKIVLSATVLLGFAGEVQAEMSREEVAIKFRRSAYSMLTWYFGPLSKMAKGISPYDRESFIHNAETLAFLVKLPKEGFIPGSDKGDTKAKPEIWSDAVGFRRANEALEKETGKLVELARGNNFDATKEQLVRVQKACKACHEDFKNRAD